MTLLHELKKFPQAYFAYLLRADLRQGLPIGDLAGVEAFVRWWDIDGEQEYGKTRQSQALIQQFNWQKVPLKQAGHHVVISRLLRDLWLSRPDLQMAFPLHKAEFLKEFEQWYLLHGLQEAKSLSPISPEMEKRCLEPYWHEDSFKYQKPSQSDDPELPYLTRMALSVWLSRDDLKASFDLTTGKDRMAYLAWSLTFGVEEQRCLALVAKAWSEVLFDKNAKEDAGKLPLFLKLMCFADRGLLERLGVRQGEVATALRKWFSTKGSQHHPELFNLYRAQQRQQEKRLAPLPRDRSYPPGVNLIGHAKGEIGIGEDVRTLALALERQGVPVHVVDVPLPASIRQQDDSVTHLMTKMPKYDTNIFCMTGFETARFYIERGSSFFANRHNIGYWPWELSKWPEPWSPVFEIVDEVWASSHFIQSTYRTACSKPVKHLPLAITVEDVADVPRAIMALPEEAFLFLFIFDFNSYMKRKNPAGLLEAFETAFPPYSREAEEEQQAVGLVFKVINADDQDPVWQAFKQQCEADNRVYIIQETLDKSEVLGLINSCNALVSLHRSEGFGRTMAEALLLGKDVIATDYSGNVDFLTAENSYPVEYNLIDLKEGDYFFCDNQQWAEPDLMDAARKMRQVFAARNTQSKAVRFLAREESDFDLDCIGRRAQALLAQRWQMRTER